MIKKQKGGKYAVAHCHGEEKGKVIKGGMTKRKATEMHGAMMANKKK